MQNLIKKKGMKETREKYNNLRKREKFSNGYVKKCLFKTTKRIQKSQLQNYKDKINKVFVIVIVI